MASLSAVVDGQPATLEQYLALPEDPRVEFIAGRLRVRPQGSRRHQQVALALATTLAAGRPPSYDVTLAWAWRVGDDEFIPDVMVHAVTDEDERFTGVPALVVEVLAEDQRADVALHRSRYATARLPHLWIVDVAARALDAFRLGPAGYRLVTRHTAAGAGGPVTVDFGIAAVVLDLPTLL